ncbi:hypothetical protein QQF64_009130 [Cirrhinus molitorella]|uniref:Uncharacterized protein n=1 Tax=Cirrhinus molitorella TaxID=172907 RepID=A0ABR3M0B0_9TELE
MRGGKLQESVSKRRGFPLESWMSFLGFSFCLARVRIKRGANPAPAGQSLAIEWTSRRLLAASAVRHLWNTASPYNKSQASSGHLYSF